MDLTREQVRRLSEYFDSAYFRYRPGPKHLAFHVSRSKRRLLRAPNQAGKTHAGAAEAVSISIEDGRWRAPLPRRVLEGRTQPLLGIVFATTDKAKNNVIAPKLRALIPPGALAPDNRYSEGRGYTNNIIRFANGNIILLRSMQGDLAGSIAGYTADWCWIDEPPYENSFGEVISRLVVADGPLFITMTPIVTGSRDLDWLIRRIEGDKLQGLAPLEDWEQYLPQLTTEDLPWRSEENLAKQRSMYAPWEMKQRAEGSWYAVTQSRQITSLQDRHIMSALPNEDFPLVILGADHGERVNHEAVVLIYVDTIARKIYVVDEYYNATPTAPHEDVEGIAQMLRRNHLSWRNVDVGIGDTNSLGKLAPGRTINGELQRLTGVVWRKPDKRAGSIDYSVTMMIRAFLKDQLFIHKTCKQTIHCLRNWDGTPKTEKYKHFIDAVRYVVTPVVKKWSEQAAEDIPDILNQPYLDKPWK